MLNARIRKVFSQKKTPIFSIGNPGDLTYDFTIIGDKTDDIKKILNNETDFSNKLSSSKKPIIIIGESALEIDSGKYIFEGFKKIKKLSKIEVNLTKNKKEMLYESFDNIKLLVSDDDDSEHPIKVLRHEQIDEIAKEILSDSF